MTWWTDGAILGSLFFGGVIGNLAASTVWESGRWAAKPILDRVPDIASLVAQGASQGNHDLLRALRRAECSVLVALCDEVLREEFDFSGNRTRVAERVALRLRTQGSAELAALCRIRRAFATMREDLRTASVDDLARVHGAALADVPRLVRAGSECYTYGDVDAMRQRVVAEQITALNRALCGDPADAGFVSTDGRPLAPDGLPPALSEGITRHPKGWWDYLLHAFREELKDPANERARAAWQFDVLNQLPQQLGATYEQFEMRFEIIDRNLSGAWNDLTTLRQQFDAWTPMILDVLQQVVQTTDGTRVAVGELHRLSEREFADLKRLLIAQIEQQPDARMVVAPDPLVAYCRHVEARLGRILPLGTDGRSPWTADVTLAQVYIELDTAQPGKVVNDDAIPLSVLEAVARHKRLVLLGGAGSGKSTFITHLAHQLAGRAAQPDARRQAMPIGWLRDGDIPVQVILRDFAAWQTSNDARLHGADVRSFIRDSLRNEELSHVWHDLERALADGRAIVLFDGLDEIPDATARTRTRDTIADFLSQYPRLGCVLTCRTLAYEDAGIRFEHLASFEIAAFDEAKIEGFIRAWFGDSAQPDGDDETSARVARLKADLERPDLEELASNPLLLTAIAILSMRGGGPIDSPPQLYRDALNLLLWQWDAAKVAAGDRADSTLQALMTEARWDAGDLEDVLAQVAYEAQERTPTRDDQIVADIHEWSLVRRLRDSRGPGQHLDWASRVVTKLKERTGLLVQRAPDVLAFPHRTFQEYLAGRHLSNGRNFASRASRLLRDGNYWLRTVLLGVSHAVHVDRELDSPLFLLHRLCPEIPDGDERRWRDVWFAGEALAAFGVRHALGDEYGSLVVNRVRQGLVALIEQQRLAPGERARAAAVLGRIGDSRFREDLWHLPADDLLGFVAISAGPSTMGSDRDSDREAYDHETPQHVVDLPAFYLAKWPVTVAQFKAFVDDERNGGFSPRDPQCVRSVPNHPVTKVTWNEALAYCRWLADRLSETDATPAALSAHLRGPRPWRITLPSEAEWEKAARGSTATVFPWGNDARRDKAHYDAPNAEKITAVGCFPAGRSQAGVEDLSGNVWEWTRSLWGLDREFPYFRYPYVPDYSGIERENLRAGPEVLRIVRGGAGELGPRWIRSAYRFWLEPFQSGGNVGFRVALSPFTGNEGR